MVRSLSWQSQKHGNVFGRIDVLVNNARIRGDDCMSIESGTQKLKIADIICGPGHAIGKPQAIYQQKATNAELNFREDGSLGFARLNIVVAVIFSIQIENEYGPVEWEIGAPGKSYTKWCKQDDVPDPISMIQERGNEPVQQHNVEDVGVYLKRDEF
ncbi:hypothetical protein DCAR_0311863 [Daucus carota subsp. sativus]|uniref:Uncharacterized protein n=1 Tax=Daucus carota subsp. sativus TaxID=79200 RepID=A0A166AQV2_DAUCS|nr:hypothetical protein DCAR_0311863 [Daucus carota subsp. sativus]